jgi:hypothetical protein
MMSREEALGFAKSSASMAFDYRNDYPTLQDSIDGHRDNIRDTLKDERCTEYEAEAWAVFDAEVARLAEGEKWKVERNHKLHFRVARKGPEGFEVLRSASGRESSFKTFAGAKRACDRANKD